MFQRDIEKERNDHQVAVATLAAQVKELKTKLNNLEKAHSSQRNNTSDTEVRPLLLGFSARVTSELPRQCFFYFNKKKSPFFSFKRVCKTLPSVAIFPVCLLSMPVISFPTERLFNCATLMRRHIAFAVIRHF